MNKKLFSVSLVIFFLLVVMLGIYLLCIGTDKQPAESVVETVNEKTKKDVGTLESMGVSTSSQTYRSEQYGFEFQYPSYFKKNNLSSTIPYGIFFRSATSTSANCSEASVDMWIEATNGFYHEGNPRYQGVNAVNPSDFVVQDINNNTFYFSNDEHLATTLFGAINYPNKNERLLFGFGIGRCVPALLGNYEGLWQLREDVLSSFKFL